MLTKKVIYPQTCDMGHDTAIWEMSTRLNLEQVLNWFEKNLHDWGTITITMNDGDILRKFDYDLYNDNIFYYNFSWECNLTVKAIISHSCFMNCDIDIQLE